MAKQSVHIIDDATPERDFMLAGSRGLELPPDGLRSYAGVAEPFPDSLLIPRSEWQARIQEREANKATNWHVIQRAGVKVKDQERTNYCWINAPTFAVECARALAGQKYIPLSPASAGAQIKNFRNVGGWGKEGLEWIVANGLVPVSQWPANAIDRQYATAANKALALRYRVSEWWEGESRNLDVLVSILLRGIVGAVGYNWWSHEVTAVDPVWMDGDVALKIGNSWGEGWSDKGYGILQGRRMLPDDLVCARTVIAD